MENDQEGTTPGSQLPTSELDTPDCGGPSSVDSKLQTNSTQELIHDTITEYAAENLGFRLTSLGYDDSLFDLGIDSMGVAEISAAIEEQTGKRLVAEAVFELETINELSEYVDSLQPLSRASADMVVSNPSNRSDYPPNIDCNTTAETCEDLDSDSIAAMVHGSEIDPIDHYRRLNRRVNQLKEADMYFFESVISEHKDAWVVADGRRMLMMASYEYLGLLGHDRLKQASLEALETFGTGHHGARLLAGTTAKHRELEDRLAQFMQSEDAIVFSSGYVTNLAAISTLVGPGDCVIGDQWNHASIIDGCRMSGAEFYEFKHNDIDSLAEQLQASGSRRTLVVVDAVFSMDGDVIDLPGVIDLCGKHNALLMVDEAHSLGMLGKNGRGVQEHFGLDADAIDIKMGTLSKTLAGSGGFVAAREEIVTYLRHHARGYIFSGALPAGQASVAVAALDVLEQEPELVTQLHHNQVQYLEGLKAVGFDTARSTTPIVPLMTGSTEQALEMTRICREDGLFVIPVCYPAVPMDAPRLRTCISAIHTPQEIDFAIDVLTRAGRATSVI